MFADVLEHVHEPGCTLAAGVQLLRPEAACWSPSRTAMARSRKKCSLSRLPAPARPASGQITFRGRAQSIRLQGGMDRGGADLRICHTTWSPVTFVSSANRASGDSEPGRLDPPEDRHESAVGTLTNYLFAQPFVLCSEHPSRRHSLPFWILSAGLFRSHSSRPH